MSGCNLTLTAPSVIQILQAAKPALMEHAPVSHVWLIESLVEIRAYTFHNGLPELAKHMEQAIQLAHVELALRESVETYDPIHEKE